jgi:hypothetical protein
VVGLRRWIRHRTVGNNRKAISKLPMSLLGNNDPLKTSGRETAPCAITISRPIVIALSPEINASGGFFLALGNECRSVRPALTKKLSLSPESLPYPRVWPATRLP